MFLNCEEISRKLSLVDMNDVDIIRVSVIDMNTAELVFSEDVEYQGGYLTHFEIQHIDDEIYGYFGNSVYLINIDKERVEDAGIELSDTDHLSIRHLRLSNRLSSFRNATI